MSDRVCSCGRPLPAGEALEGALCQVCQVGGGDGPPPKGLATAGGILSILVALLYLVTGIMLVVVAEGMDPEGSSEGGGLAYLLFWALGLGVFALGAPSLILGILATRAWPGTLIVSGVVNALLALLLFAYLITSSWDLHLILLCGLPALAALVCSLAVGQARAYQSWEEREVPPAPGP